MHAFTLAVRVFLSTGYVVHALTPSTSLSPLCRSPGFQAKAEAESKKKEAAGKSKKQSGWGTTSLWPVKKAWDPDYEELVLQLQSACDKVGLTLSALDDDPFDSDRFDLNPLPFGPESRNTEGLPALLCVDEMELYAALSRGERALDEEIEMGTEEDKECYSYVKNEEAGSSSKTFQNGWKRDCDPATGDVLPERQVDDPAAPGGKRGKRLDDFANSEMAKRCKLTRLEVLALRFYSTAGFKSINWGLRDVDRWERRVPHRLPVMVFLLHSGTKKLFTKLFIGATSSASMVHLFRGMSNRKLESDFMQRGGTELAPMSTTKDVSVAILHSTHWRVGGQSILLRVRTTAGAADITWLSAFPFEREDLFPPGTFLKPLRPKPYLFQISGTIFYVVDVEPRLM